MPEGPNAEDSRPLTSLDACKPAVQDLGGNSRPLRNAAPLSKPQLYVQKGNLPATAQAVRDVLKGSVRLFDRGSPCRIARTACTCQPAVEPLNRHSVVVAVHGVCQPVAHNGRGELVEVTLPDRVAQLYMEMRGEWELPPLDGISSAPLLAADGGIRSVEGYDPLTRLWCSGAVEVSVPACPSQVEAEAALAAIRHQFRTFPFADSPRRWDEKWECHVVDTSKPPEEDESAFLVGLLTAICRASLQHAPGFLVSAPKYSGAGTGKGLLIRAICEIAFGVQPSAFTLGNDHHELDKRLGAELAAAGQVIFLDNANGVTLRSDTLASALTERPARVRLLGTTRTVAINSAAFVAVTGNGVSVAEDLARRFLHCHLDAHCEDPEARRFKAGFLEEIVRNRSAVLGDCLTIWRWGRQNLVPVGKPLGSFETWSAWCRDSLLALGCRDPVERTLKLKGNDSDRQFLTELFQLWWERHGSSPMKVSDLAVDVAALFNPHGRGRQYLARKVGQLENTRVAGFFFTRQSPAGRWSAATYALKNESGKPSR